MNCPECQEGWLNAGTFYEKGKKRVGVMCNRCEYKVAIRLVEEWEASEDEFLKHTAAR